MRVPYAVACECGRTTPVTERQMGFKVACGCTLVVVVPLKAEFDRKPLLKTAGTVVKRIERLQIDGELFGRECSGCGTEYDARVVPVTAMLFLWWSEPVRHDRDFKLDVPFRICPRCRKSLEPSSRVTAHLAVTVVVLLVSGLFGAWLGWRFSLLVLLHLVAAFGYHAGRTRRPASADVRGDARPHPDVCPSFVAVPRRAGRIPAVPERLTAASPHHVRGFRRQTEQVDGDRQMLDLGRGQRAHSDGEHRAAV